MGFFVSYPIASYPALYRFDLYRMSFCILSCPDLSYRTRIKSPTPALSILAKLLKTIPSGLNTHAQTSCAVVFGAAIQ